MKRLAALAVLLAAACTTTTVPETSPTTVPTTPETSTPTAPEPTNTEPTDTGPSNTGPSNTVPSTTVLTSPTTTIPPTTTTTVPPDQLAIQAFQVPPGSRPHDVAPAADGGVWYTGQNSGELGWLDPETGDTRQIDLGPGARPHGVITDHNGVAWVTDGGLNAIVSYRPDTGDLMMYPLPDSAPDANLNTAAFDSDGILWFTGQAGIYGRLDPASGEMEIFEAPGGRGPYGITSTPDGTIVYASLAGSYVGEILDDAEVEILGPPTPGQGARRVWSDSNGDIWVAEWNTGNVSRYQASSGTWTTWRLPGESPAAYAVYVDESDIVWLTDFGGDAVVRFDPATEQFHVYPLPHAGGNVRQLLGRPGEVWGAESAADHLIVIRTR